MITPSKKLIFLFFIFSLMMLSVNLYAKERQGAKLIITKKDGQLIKGELIAVKPNSVLLLDTEGKDVSVDIADIRVIRIVKKSRGLEGALWGSLGGALTGAIFAAMTQLTLIGALAVGLGGGSVSSLMARWGAIGALVGVIAGAIAGAVEGIDKTIQIEGMSDSEIQETMDKLRKKARIRDYK